MLDSEWESALCRSDTKEIIKGLNQGKDPDALVGRATFRTPIQIACSRNNLNIIELLIMRGANLNGYARSPIHSTKNPDCIKLLFQHKADIDQQDKYGRSSLMIATEDSQREFIQFLLEQKANPTRKGRSGIDALEIARQKVQSFPDMSSFKTHAQETYDLIKAAVKEHKETECTVKPLTKS